MASEPKEEGQPSSDSSPRSLSLNSVSVSSRSAGGGIRRVPPSLSGYTSEGSRDRFGRRGTTGIFSSSGSGYDHWKRRSGFLRVNDSVSASIYESGGFVDDQLNNAAIFEDCASETGPLLPLHLSVQSVIEESALHMPAGPLSFVDTNLFLYFSGVVIIFNVIIMLNQSSHAEDWQDKWSLMNQMCLVFYVFELLARLGHWKLRFFTHPRDRYWNWLDFLIVILLGLDQWLFPLFKQTEIDQAWVPILRIFRMTRFLRLFKLLRVIVYSDFSWAEEPWFQSVVAFMISFNAIVMGLETDIRSGLWMWVDHAMLIFFMFELAVRFKRDGWKFFTNQDDRFWNILDFTIVVTGIMDLWVMKAYRIISQTQGDTQFGQMIMLMRTLRLMRLLRLLRLVKAVRPLYVLAMGVLEAMQSMIWVLVLTIVALYSFAIITTRLIGHGSLAASPQDIPPRARELFKTVADSMFTLFAVMNGQDWQDIEPLLAEMPVTKPIFVIFTIYSSWALLSVMTGVVSDNMLRVRVEHEESNEQALLQRHQMLRGVLGEVFASADVDGSGWLRRDAYFEVLNIPFHTKKIQAAASVPLKDVRSMFDWLDDDGTGVIQFEDFLSGFHCLNDKPSGKSLLQLDSDTKVRFAQIQTSMQALEDEVETLRLRAHVHREEIMNVLREFASPY